METFATYNKKLAGYRDVSETVKIIEKIAAGQLHILEQKTESLAEYTHHILAALSRVNHLLSDSTPKSTSITDKTLLVVFTGDKGLVGDLWRRLFSLYAEDSQQDILVFGKKGQQQWPESTERVTHCSFTDRVPTSEELQSLAMLLTGYIDEETYRTVSTLHLCPTSLVEQNPELTQLLPIDITEARFTTTDTYVSEYPIIEGSLHSLQKKLYRKYLYSHLQQVILETAVSEYSARTVAMEHASTKIDEARNQLSMVYSRDKRQRETQKQLERFASHHVII